MRVLINGEQRDCRSSTLADLLHELEYEGEWLATAVNGDLVHREDRSRHILGAGDRVEILSPMQGG
ncbi:sulfur carrier protein ThiS [Rhizobium sp. LC145]|jgi:thiamine biosynthesis protein ThiS|uniref:sulfur carrier protein ThiS n=1 Tax=Rhizobium sp. LC145 TaxID=1120688 RepID=UPI0009E53F6A|nr:sulfur carrier protein ThiS [Rhizobium sp. LC145]TKT45182.1 sulfur carrier protein ThiS [Rhizobiaceae bacterium LC148]